MSIRLNCIALAISAVAGTCYLKKCLLNDSKRRKKISSPDLSIHNPEKRWQTVELKPMSTNWEPWSTKVRNTNTPIDRTVWSLHHKHHVCLTTSIYRGIGQDTNWSISRVSGSWLAAPPKRQFVLLIYLSRSLSSLSAIQLGSHVIKCKSRRIEIFWWFLNSYLDKKPHSNAQDWSRKM